jgi:hypothetical protein
LKHIPSLFADSILVVDLLDHMDDMIEINYKQVAKKWYDFSILIFHMMNTSQIYHTFDLKDPNSENKVAQKTINVNMMLNLDRIKKQTSCR